jgi:hypothetical protein
MVSAWLAVFTVVRLSGEPHHSPVLFDQGRELTLEGSVTRMEWTNPHVSIHLEVIDRRERPVAWIIEAQSPRVMSLFGWSAASVRRGDRVRIAAHPPRHPAARTALGRSIVRQDGTSLRIPWQPEEIREALRSESRRR